MALPTPPPYTNPIPNNPFSYALNPYVCGPYFPIAVGAGIDITTGATVPKLVNEVQDVLAAGPGITLTTFLGVTTITASGGGGGATPATPTALGTVAGYTDITDTDFNTSLGYCALGVGAGSGSGFANVAVGLCAGCAVTTAYGNTLIGPGTGISIDTGNTNTALGIGALSCATSGFANVGIGMCSGCAYTTESGNAVLGGHFGDVGDTNALILADGPGNLKAKFNGVGALSFDGTSYGTANQVLLSAGSGAKPTWGGLPVASQTTLGVVYSRSASLGITDTNVSLGYNAIGALTANSARNVAIGKDALCALDSFDDDNTAVGYGAFPSLTAGSGNTALGSGGFFGIGSTLVSGNCNVVIGFGADVSSSSVNNQVTISSGAGAQRFTAAGNWAAVSDARDKTDIQDLALGLDFLKEVQPRQFAWDMRHTDANKGEKTTGFIAQEVQAVVEKFDAVEYAKLVDTADENKWMLSQTQFVPILVKAIQELSAKVEALEAKLEANG